MHHSKLRLGVVGVACAMVVGMPNVAIGGTEALATGSVEAIDGYLRIAPDDYGAWSSTTFGGAGDRFNPDGPFGPMEAAFTSGFFLFVPGLNQRELLTDNAMWQAVMSADGSLDRLITSPLIASDATGNGVNDTADSSFEVFGGTTALAFVLKQEVFEKTLGVSYVQQKYTITNNSVVAITFVMVRAFDGDLLWNAGFENDEVGTSMHGAELGPYVFEQEASDPGITAITLSSLMGGHYYGGKNGITPAGGPPAYGFGTDVQVWDAFGLPTSWQSHIAGVGYDTDGVSGPFPAGSTPPEDGAIGLAIPLSLDPGESTTFTVFHTYGQNTPVTPIIFENPQEFAAAGEPVFQATGDFNGDGDIDVVVAIPDLDPMLNGTVQVFLNQGTDMADLWLGFVSNKPVPVGREPTGVAVGLFDADMHLDVAVTNAGDNTVSILFGTGDGSLSPPVDITVGNRPSAIVADNFNLNVDTFVDLAVTNQLDSNVMLLLNDGMGNFPPPPAAGGGGGAGGGFPTFDTGGNGVSLISDDFDGNKRPDMAGTESTSGLAGPTGLVFVLLGQGDGTFDPVAVYDVGMDPLDLANADLQQDGAVDIVAVNSGDGTISILINQQDGTFLPAFTLPVGLNPRSIDAVDLNGDGDSDLAVVADDAMIGPSVQVLANRIDLGGGLVFEDPVAFGVNADPNFVVSADLNNDGIFDLVTVNADDGATMGSVTVLLADPIFPLVSCPWDCQASPSGSVDVPDLLALLGAWGGPQTPGTTCDFDESGVIAVPDLLELLANWGPCP